jgi:AAA family ATP:ADP antiporter
MKHLIKIHQKELFFSVNMFSIFFLIITTFWILKPLKKGLFYTFYKEQSGFSFIIWQLSAAQAELFAKVINVFIALIVVILFSWLSRRIKREKLVYLFMVFFITSFFGSIFILNNPTEISVWLFYLLGDLYNTAMVVTFFAFLNDSVSHDSAKRLYGPIILGGVAGGVAGSTIVTIGAQPEHVPAWLLVCIFNCIVILFNTYFASIGTHDDLRENYKAVKKSSQTRKIVVAEDFFRNIVSSPYVVSIAVIVGSYEIVSELIDFQFSSTIERYSTTENVSHIFSRVYAGSNWISLFVQLFLTTIILTKYGIKAGLLILPYGIFASTFIVAFFPQVVTVSMLYIIDNGLSYSINQSAKEILYVPAGHEIKYSAKAFIDMFIQRLGKVIAIMFLLIFSTIFSDTNFIRWISVFTIVLVLFWIRRAKHAAAIFQNVTKNVL